ncbi:hypothetical protein EC973_005665 [Apophysomyces ossiformis]|uniref:Rrp15p-domain-containing protein n=1 Tax=Apophysomyces ossiformis TaxID=679940 RepID=A0A8H7ELY4_9FUNG|nr:hypothetical protein EC973_005665 [Apophysomyces ossiformis]
MARKAVKKQEKPVELEEKRNESVASEGSDDDMEEQLDSDNESSADDDDRDSFDESDMESDAEDDEMELEDIEDRAEKGSSEAFSEAMTKILASTLKGTDKKQPILARSKGTERKIEDEKLEYKARKILSSEKKALKSKGRVIPDYTTFDYEKNLRKVATRGVVKLFNAVRTQQKVTEVAISKAAETRKTRNAIEKAKDVMVVSTMSKSSFLDLLKTGSGAKA